MTGTADRARPRPVPRSAGNRYPLSYVQEELWFLQQFAPESTTYNTPVVWRLDGEIDLAAVRRVVDQLVRRHESLRTRFVEYDGVPYQIVDPIPPVITPIIDVVGIPGFTERLREDVDRAHDLTRGAWTRSKIYRLRPAVHVVLLDLHHIVTDEWSESVLWRDFVALYGKAVRGCPGTDGLPDLPLRYVDFAVWQREFLAGPDGDRLADHWRRRLAGAAVLPLPLDRPRPRTQTFRGDALAVRIPATLHAAVETLGRHLGATPFTCYLAAFAALLAQWCGEHDVVIGTITTGRSRAVLREIVGFFVNTLALRIDVGGEPDLPTLIARVRRVTMEAFAHEAMPFRKVVEAVPGKRGPGRSPLFQVLFTLGSDAVAPAREHPPGVHMCDASLDLPVARFDIVLNVEVRGGRADAVFEFNTELFDRRTIAGVAERFVALLGRSVDSPSSPLTVSGGRTPC